VPEVFAERKAEIEQSLATERVNFKETSELLTTMEKVVAGTFVQSLINDESHRRQTKYVNNGLKSADISMVELSRMNKKALEIIEVHEAKPAYIPKR
jgi:hypothetical protein